MPGSVAALSVGGSSTRGRSGPVYRTVARCADVDETLFGSANKTRGPYAEKEIQIVGKDTVQVRKKYNNKAKAGGGGEQAIVIGAAELNRLRENARVLTKEEELEQKQRQEESYRERMEKSAARKEKIRKLEEERKRAAAVNGLDSKAGGGVGTNSVLDRARQMQDEEKDDVKHMNQMLLYSKVASTRDAQIVEKAQINWEKEGEEKELDAMMEIKRLQALKMYEVRERERLEAQRSGAKVIVEQIKDRQSQRMREEECRDQERAFVLKQIEALKAEEVEQQRQKKMAAEKLLGEVNAVNSAAMKIKEEKMMAQQVEELKIVEYQKSKDQRDREVEEEKARVAAEKEKETARLRAMQEKAQDKAAEMDALRAKRAVEAAERTARQKERAEKDRLDAINKELNAARQQQQAEKERRLGEQAKYERDEFERIIAVQLAQEEAERQRQAEERSRRTAHQQELQSQIAAREEQSFQERRDFLEEGNTVRSQIVAERKKLETIKERKMQELQKSGVPEKYWAELAKKKISV